MELKKLAILFISLWAAQATLSLADNFGYFPGMPGQQKPAMVIIDDGGSLKLVPAGSVKSKSMMTQGQDATMPPSQSGPSVKPIMPARSGDATSTKSWQPPS